jgi:hypothetical protein
MDKWSNKWSGTSWEKSSSFNEPSLVRLLRTQRNLEAHATEHPSALARKDRAMVRELK